MPLTVLCNHSGDSPTQKKYSGQVVMLTCTCRPGKLTLFTYSTSPVVLRVPGILATAL